MSSTQNSTPTTASTSSSPSTSSNVTQSENGPTKRESPGTVEDRYPGNVFKGKWYAVHVWAFCPGCSTKKEAEAHASTQIKKNAENPEYEMVNEEGIIHVKTIPIEAGHFNLRSVRVLASNANGQSALTAKPPMSFQR